MRAGLSSAVKEGKIRRVRKARTIIDPAFTPLPPMNNLSRSDLHGSRVCFGSERDFTCSRVTTNSRVRGHPRSFLKIWHCPLMHPCLCTPAHIVPQDPLSIVNHREVWPYGINALSVVHTIRSCGSISACTPAHTWPCCEACSPLPGEGHIPHCRWA